VSRIFDALASAERSRADASTSGAPPQLAPAGSPDTLQSPAAAAPPDAVRSPAPAAPPETLQSPQSPAPAALPDAVRSPAAAALAGGSLAQAGVARSGELPLPTDAGQEAEFPVSGAAWAPSPLESARQAGVAVQPEPPLPADPARQAGVSVPAEPPLPFEPVRQAVVGVQPEPPLSVSPARQAGDSVPEPPLRVDPARQAVSVPAEPRLLVDPTRQAGDSVPAEPPLPVDPVRQAEGPVGARRVAGAPEPSTLRYDERGLVPVVVQDVGSGAVLMLAYADRRAVEMTLATGEAHFWSRSRQRLWRKGETSGNILAVAEMVADCDGDALLLRVRPSGPTCHRGTRSCFEPNAAALELGWLAAVVAERRGADPVTSYTARLLGGGVERVAQKVGEEGVETVIAALAAAARPDRRAELVGECSDLLFHLLVLLEASDVPPADLAAELARRHAARAAEPLALARNPTSP
jgi:phosphoribosyl-ATP pyrophosphohydrolase/phosphoribosyl-AMP cyclohydrolase